MNVSLIIPVYNVAPYVKECLDSVMEQTFTGSMECIVVDDCATDDSMDIVREMIAAYNGPIKFVTVRHEHNRGLSASRNTGLDNANGEYVFFLDSDDKISKDCIELLYSKVKVYPDNIMVQGRTATIPANVPNPFHKKYKQECALSNDDVRNCFFKKQCMSESAWNNLIKRQYLITHSFRFKEERLGEDQLWMFFLLKQLENVCFVNSITYYYRRREDSISNTSDHEQRAKFIGSIGYNFHDYLTNLTPHKEKEELNFYSYSFSYFYVLYVKEIPVFEEDYHLYLENAKKYGCHYVKMKLWISHLLGKFKMGWWILMMLKSIRHPIDMSKKVWQSLVYKAKR